MNWSHEKGIFTFWNYPSCKAGSNIVCIFDDVIHRSRGDGQECYYNNLSLAQVRMLCSVEKLLISLKNNSMTYNKHPLKFQKINIALRRLLQCQCYCSYPPLFLALYPMYDECVLFTLLRNYFMARSSRHITKNMERKDKMIYVFKNRIFKIEEWMVNVRVTSLWWLK